MTRGGPEKPCGSDEFYDVLRAYEGRPAAVSGVGKDRVNEPMIRHWCEAMGDNCSAYTGPDAVAPPTMLQAWTMGGLSGHGQAGRSQAYDELLGLLDAAGCTAVVATDCEQDYLRPLRPGDRITFDAVIESVSPRKTTRLGTGYFVTTRTDVRADGEPAGIHRFRILKYAPHGTLGRGAGRDSADRRGEAVRAGGNRAEGNGAGGNEGEGNGGEEGTAGVNRAGGNRAEGNGAEGEERAEGNRAGGNRAGEARPGSARRPRPVINRDNAGFWEGVTEHRLLIQRCGACGILRFPWLPGCNACGSSRWDTVEASGEGTVHSYVVMHHPPFPAFDPPYAVGLIELAEGVRMISNVVGVPYDKVRIGMPVRLEFQQVDEELELPVFRGGGET